jgi:GT2 family glycosyltransferase
MSPPVSAIVVAFAKEALLERCLRSLNAALAAVDGTTELIVVVNHLSAEGRQMLQRVTREVVIIDVARNLGFAGGVNAGLDRARGQWVALVNDDCVVAPDALVAMLSAAETCGDIGSVAAQIRLAAQPETINSAGIGVDALGIAYERLLGELATASETEVVDVFGASAAAALYRRRMLDEIGGFDDSFFAYLEDADVAWRAQMRGWRSVYAPTAVVVHDHSTTLGHRSAEKHFLVGRNRVRMLAKNASRSQLIEKGLGMVVYDVAYVAYAATTGRTLAPLRGRLQGLRDWRSYRAAGRPDRCSIRLVPSSGIRGALRRDRAYGGT